MLRKKKRGREDDKKNERTFVRVSNNVLWKEKKTKFRTIEKRKEGRNILGGGREGGGVERDSTNVPP